ncbi:DUF2786 domain-containing protein [Sphaerisporangium rufum]|uniref:DUF2786 domain-containing protein n=1 Tax=Sphaerisporangium rufum TaxID=1381558 RepID=UPI00194DCD34|nr:DUF2786 domain-containing protein [Sphaerisporangium rufum]
MHHPSDPAAAATDAANDKVMERVRRLLELAEHPRTGEEEAALASAHAAALMLRHGLTAAAVRRRRTGRAETIDGIEMEVSNRGGHARERCWALHLVCDALGCKGAQHWTGVKGRGIRGARRVTLTVVGPEAVLDDLRILLPSLTLQMENQVAPALRRATAEADAGHPPGPAVVPGTRAGARNGPDTGPAASRPLAGTKSVHGDAPGAGADAGRRARGAAGFRRAFYVGFGAGVAARLRERMAEMTEELAGTGAELVLLDRTALVRAEFDRRFPGLRHARTTPLDADGYHTGRAAGHRADLGDRTLHSPAAALPPRPAPR